MSNTYPSILCPAIPSDAACVAGTMPICGFQFKCISSGRFWGFNMVGGSLNTNNIVRKMRYEYHIVKVGQKPRTEDHLQQRAHSINKWSMESCRSISSTMHKWIARWSVEPGVSKDFPYYKTLEWESRSTTLLRAIFGFFHALNLHFEDWDSTHNEAVVVAANSQFNSIDSIEFAKMWVKWRER